MMKNSMFRAFVRYGAGMAALAIASVATPAAAEGQKARTVWNPQDPVAEIQAGKRVCEGNRQQSLCVTWFRITGELFLNYVGRAESGIGRNVNIVRILVSTPEGLVMRNEAGQTIQVLGHVTDTENGPARWTSGLAGVPAAFMNGGLGSIVNATLGGCGGGSCGGGAVAMVFNSATANSAVNAALGGCTSNSCLTAPTLPPGHTQD